MLDINQDTSDEFSQDTNSYSRHDLNISRALGMALENETIDGMMFVNIIRVAMGHRILLSQGRTKIQQVFSDNDEQNLTEDEEIDEILKDIK